jgi:DNA replication and repair protein RecF
VEIVSLSTEGFRNLLNGRVELHPRLNLVVGDNGQGKTNLLEALALVSGRSSFRTRELAEARQHRAARSAVSARLRDDAGDPRNVTTLGFVHAGGAREQDRDGKRVTRLTAARSLPAVFLTARDLSRLSGPPAERRAVAVGGAGPR